MQGSADLDQEVVVLGSSDEEPEEIELDEEASPEDKARAMIGASPADDPLKALLSVDSIEPLTDTWRCKRLGVDFQLQGFRDDRAYEMVVERATHYVRRRGANRQRELDNRKLSKLLVIEGCVSPCFSQARDPASFEKLAEKYGSSDPEVLVGRALLPGEIDQIAEKVLELSGFNDDLEEVAGN